MKKTTLFTSLAFLTILSLSFASAYSFSDFFESFTYESNPGQGFSIFYESSVPSPDKQVQDAKCNFKDHTADQRYLKRCLELNKPSFDHNQFSADAYFDARHRYNLDRELRNAHRSYDLEVRQKSETERLRIREETRLEELRIRERNRHRHSSFGYYYRPYSYYW